MSRNLPPDDYYYNPERTADSWSDRTGAPDSFSAGIGRVVLNFSKLEASIETGILKCLRVSPEVGQILTAELSFKVKLHILSALVRHLSGSTRFSANTEDPLDCWDKILVQCFRAEEMRNQVLHSRWEGPYLRDSQATRRKVTAKAARGLFETSEVTTDADLLDIADYTIQLATHVEEFFFIE